MLYTLQRLPRVPIMKICVARLNHILPHAACLNFRLTDIAAIGDVTYKVVSLPLQVITYLSRGNIYILNIYKPVFMRTTFVASQINRVRMCET